MTIFKLTSHTITQDRVAYFRKELPAAALRYAAAGYPVFPALMSGGSKKPMVRWGKGETTIEAASRAAEKAKIDHPSERWKHSPLYHLRASINPEIIKAWWAKWPLAMIGMPTGKASGVVVLDIDRKNGVDGLANLRAFGLDPYAMSPVRSVTPSGGLHVFMRYTGPIRNSASMLAAGVDIRGDGGYAVLPPSLPSLAREEYQWEGANGLV